ncbi:MAG: DNA-binding transcriptional LysR family regulator [Myxococcota bacterium]|jgi:DNA-binding transcriptional LysR family regulator
MKIESLEELRIFAQIVESGSLTAAARALGLPSNTVSRRLAALEERLDTRLLYRTTRSLSLSETGRILLSRARRILQEVEATETALQGEKEGLSGMVRISVPSLLTADLLASMKALLREHPGLRLQVRVNDKPVNPVAEGLDVVVIGGTLSDSTLIARKLSDIHPVLVASEEYLHRRGHPEKPADLIDHEILLFVRDPPQSHFTLTDSSGHQHTVAVEGRFEADDGRTLMDALAAGIGIGLTSPRIMRVTPSLRRVLPGYSLGSFPIYAIYPASRQRSARLQVVIEALRGVLQDPEQG